MCIRDSFKFEGGKGVATALGVLFGISGWLGLATALTWLIIAFFFRYSSLASLVAALFAPFYQLLIWGPGPMVLPLIVMSLLLVWRHEGNIRKLLAGTESRLGQKTHPGTATTAANKPPPHGHSQPHRHPPARGHRKGHK